MEPIQLAEPTSLEDFKALPCILLFTDPDYIEPTHLEVKSLIRLAGLSQSRVAKITGMKVQYHAKPATEELESPSETATQPARAAKGSNTVRRWLLPHDNANSRQIPYAAWRLLLLHSGVVSLDDELKQPERTRSRKQPPVSQ